MVEMERKSGSLIRDWFDTAPNPIGKCAGKRLTILKTQFAGIVS